MPESTRTIWRRLIPPAILACGVILFRGYLEFQREGALTAGNVGSTVLTLVLLFAIFNVVVWHVTRTKKPPPA